MTGQVIAAYEAWPLLFWVFGSVLAYALFSNAAWVVKRGLKNRGARLPLSGDWLAEAWALFFFVGVPYLVLGGWPRAPFSGQLSPVDMGIVGLGGDWTAARWLESAGTGLALGLAAVATLAAGWGLANRGDGRLGFEVGNWWRLPVHGFYREVHWAFYRAALTVTVARTPWTGDVYAGTWAAFALVLFEWACNPAWRSAWRDPDRAGLAWLGIGLALLSTLLFLFTRNLWICIAVHWLVSGTVTAVAHASAVKVA